MIMNALHFVITHLFNVMDIVPVMNNLMRTTTITIISSSYLRLINTDLIAFSLPIYISLYVLCFPCFAFPYRIENSTENGEAAVGG